MSQEEIYLLEKARQNIQAMELLIEQGFLDIAASRGYYVLFYIAEALLLRKKLHFASHAAVISAFGREFAKTGEFDPVYHQYLIKAQEARQFSDYGLNPTGEGISSHPVEILKWAKGFMIAAERYLL